MKLARSLNTSQIFQNFELGQVYFESQDTFILPQNLAIWKKYFYLMDIVKFKYDDNQNNQKNLFIYIIQAIAFKSIVAIHIKIKIPSYMYKKRLCKKK